MNKDKIIILSGNEEFLIDNFIEKTINKNTQSKETDYIKIETIKNNADEIIGSINTISFFNANRVLLIENSDFLTSGKNPEKNYEKNDEKKLSEYIEKKNDENVIIFLLKNKSPDNRKKLVKLIKERGSIIKYDKYDKNELTSWIGLYFSKNNRKISKRNASYIGEISGYLGRESEKSLYDVKNQLDILISYTEEKSEITAEHIDEVLNVSIDKNIFKLTDAVVEGKREEAFSIFSDMIKNNVSPFQIIYMISRQFRMLKYFSLLHREGKSDYDIAKEMKIQNFLVNKMKQQTRKMTYDEIEKYNEKCLEAERKAKHGEMDLVTGIELLILM